MMREEKSPEEAVVDDMMTRPAAIGVIRGMMEADPTLNEDDRKVCEWAISALERRDVHWLREFAQFRSRVRDALYPSWESDPGASHEDVIDAVRRAVSNEAASEMWLPNDIRQKGWMIVCHNDYRQSGRLMTFWSFTKDGRYVSGEGINDLVALNQIRGQINP